MNNYFNANYPEINDLRAKAKKRMPKFAFDYIEGGCDQEVCLQRNEQAAKRVILQTDLLQPFHGCDMSTELFGHRYSTPFGIAPIGLQGLMWPNTPEILAKAAAEKNIPFILSTVSSSSLERIAEISEGKAWFQLYNPTDPEIRADLLKRVSSAQYPVLVVTVDVPTFGFRPRDIKNNLAMPPKMTLANILQMVTRPRWLLETVLAGKPEMQTLKPYMSNEDRTEELAQFMNRTAMGPVDLEGLKPIRSQWQGPLVIKGLLSAQDIESAISLGADGVVISNHGGRQLDAAEAPVNFLRRVAPNFKNRIKLMVDGGLRSGTNIAGALACGADFAFLGRPFVYGVAALGKWGGFHTINSLAMQLEQVIAQLRCGGVADLPKRLLDESLQPYSIEAQ